MPKARTPWAKRALHAAIDQEKTTAEIAKELGLDQRYVSAVMYGRVIVPVTQKRISDYLGISDSDV